MCGRYRLDPEWDDYPNFRVPADFEPNVDVHSATSMPIIRLIDGEWQTEMRSWGFVRTRPDKSGKMVKDILFNAAGEGLPTNSAFRKAFANSRCLVPMSSWYEWPEAAGVKEQVEIGMNGRKVFVAAGLFETSKDAATGESIETFTMVTVPPNELLGTVLDRAPLVLRDQDLDTWCKEGTVLAQSLIRAHPDPSAFWIRPF